ncbi:MAG: hypothetical protein LBQ52_02705, partial [Helicobacteraceae bacterium]|nr:hypothetical protein [Helicobacteraceae bacterium]
SETNGSVGSPIANAINASYSPSTATEGTLYYYVVVTNTNNGAIVNKTATAKSDTAKIEISALLLEGYHNVSFYNAELDLVEIRSIEEGLIDPTDYNNSVSWYKAEESTPTTEHTLTGNVRFYALPNVHEIYTEADLDNARNNLLNHNYIMFNDIELTSATLDDSEGWEPIGYGIGLNEFFRGVFNGNGYAIRNLWINRSTNYVGLFGYIGGAQIKNLGVEIDNSKGGVKGPYCVGAIAGCVDDNSSITNSYSTGNVSGDNNVGAIAGYVHNNSSITNSYSTGDVSGTGDYVGGIAGAVGSSNITNSYSTGNVSGIGRYGYVGGIAGYVVGSTIENNAAINQEINGSAKVNRIVGDISGSDVQNNFALNTMTTSRGGGFSDAGDPRHRGISKSDSDLKSQSTYSNAINGDGLGGLGWKFGNDEDNPWVWGAFDGYPYPTLYWQTEAP